MADTTPMQASMLELTPRPLTPETFARFGAVLGPERLVLCSTEFPFFANIVPLQPPHLPITYVNRHHDHQQLFLTLDGAPMIVVVAAPTLSGAELRLADIQAFVTDGNTAIVLHIDTWHIAPRAAGVQPSRALNVQATNNQVHTERLELEPAFGRALVLRQARPPPCSEGATAT